MKYLILLLMLSACTQMAIDTTPDIDVTEETTELVRTSPTYAYDGQNLTIISEEPVRFTFTSTHAGYGDRSDVELPLQNTVHIVEVINGSSIIDGIWDDSKGKMIAESPQNLSAAHAMTCIDSVPDPMVSYAEGALVITYFSEYCGPHEMTYRFDEGVYPPTLRARISERMEDCPIECGKGVSTFRIETETVGAVVLDYGKVYTRLLGSFACTNQTCPQGYFCAKPERGGICVLNSTESEEVLYERYAALQ